MVAAAELGMPVTSGPYQGMAALDAWTYEDLKRDIEANGVILPIVVTQDGVIVDGHHRWKIASELGITESVPVEVRTYHSQPAIEAEAIGLNSLRRQMSKDERNRHIVRMRELNMTQAQIAERLGLSRVRVSEIDSSMSETDKLTDDEILESLRLKPRKPGQRLARYEVAAVESKITELLDEGQSHAAIADVVGLTPSGVSMRVKSMRQRGAHQADDRPLHEQIAEHARKGMTSRQIAKAVNLHEQTVRVKARQHDIDIPADRASYKKSIDTDAAMGRAIEHLGDALYAFKHIPMHDLSQEQTETWVCSLDQVATDIRTLIREIRKLTKEQTQHDQA